MVWRQSCGRGSVSLPNETPPPQPQPGGNLAGCALFSIGLLLVIPSGICTAIGGVGLVAGMISDPAALANEFDDILPFAAMTLIPLGIGIVLLWAGIRMRR